jgi:hypothetical protein
VILCVAVMEYEAVRVADKVAVSEYVGDGCIDREAEDVNQDMVCEVVGVSSFVSVIPSVAVMAWGADEDADTVADREYEREICTVFDNDSE